MHGTCIKICISLCVNIQILIQAFIHFLTNRYVRMLRARSLGLEMVKSNRPGEAVRQGARGRVRTFDSLGDHFLVNDYDPAKFALKLAHKDVSLATELGRDVGVPMRSLGLTQAEMSEALNRGWGERDSRVSMLLQLERAGVNLAEDKAAIRSILEADG